MKTLLLTLPIVSFLIVSCGGGGSPAGTNVSAQPAALAAASPAGANEQTKPASSISAERQLQIEDRLVSIFENSTLEIQYGYIQNLNDGRGYTAGRSGFTTGTADLLHVVETYTKSNPNNALAPFLPALRAVNGTASTNGLDGLVAAWQSSVADPLFIAAQDEVNDVLYRQPARKLADQLGATLPLSKAALYEAGIQHGYGNDYDSVKQIAQRASGKVGGAPGSGVSEKIWLQAFLEERKSDLLSPANQATAVEWAASVDRANAMLSICSGGNFALDMPITIVVFGKSYVL